MAVTAFGQTWFGHPYLAAFGQTEFGQYHIWPIFIFVGWGVRGPEGVGAQRAETDFGQTDFGQTDFGQKIWPTLANLNWPTLAKIGVADFFQTDFGQFYCFSIFLFF